MRLLIALALSLASSAASAHVGVGSTHGLMIGFGHPLSGIDHILAMVAVGTFAANLGGRAIWAAPLTFMTFMAVGGTLGILGVRIPFVELGIALSSIVLGLVVAIRVDWPVAAAMALVGVFAIVHGHAHATEMPLDASGASYAAGFVTATGLLHLIGIGLGLGMGALSARITNGERFTQVGGALISLLGVGILVGAI